MSEVIGYVNGSAPRVPLTATSVVDLARADAAALLEDDVVRFAVSLDDLSMMRLRQALAAAKFPLSRPILDTLALLTGCQFVVWNPTEAMPGLTTLPSTTSFSFSSSASSPPSSSSSKLRGSSPAACFSHSLRRSLSKSLVQPSTSNRVFLPRRRLPSSSFPSPPSLVDRR